MLDAIMMNLPPPTAYFHENPSMCIIDDDFLNLFISSCPDNSEGIRDQDNSTKEAIDRLQLEEQGSCLCPQLEHFQISLSGALFSKSALLEFIKCKNRPKQLVPTSSDSDAVQLQIIPHISKLKSISATLHRFS